MREMSHGGERGGGTTIRSRFHRSIHIDIHIISAQSA